MPNAKKRKNLIRRALLIVAAVILGLSFFKWNAQNITGNRMPMPFGLGLSVILSGSMEPTLQVNDLVIIRETKDVQTGDIIVFQSMDALIIHRVMEIDGETIITKGDANNAPDEPISRSDIKGVMTASISGVGALVQLVRKPAVAVGVLAAAVVLTELSYRKDKKESQQELDELEEEIRRLMDEIKDKA